MRLTALINLGNFENLKFESDDLETMRECATQLAREISKLESYEGDNYIQCYLLPLIYDKSRKISRMVGK